MPKACALYGLVSKNSAQTFFTSAKAPQGAPKNVPLRRETQGNACQPSAACSGDNACKGGFGIEETVRRCCCSPPLLHDAVPVEQHIPLALLLQLFNIAPACISKHMSASVFRPPNTSQHEAECHGSQSTMSPRASATRLCTFSHSSSTLWKCPLPFCLRSMRRLPSSSCFVPASCAPAPLNQEGTPPCEGFFTPDCDTCKTTSGVNGLSIVKLHD